MESGIWALIGISAAVLTATSFLPQLIVRLKNPKAARVSYLTLICFLVGVSLWTAYGVHLKDMIIIGANCFIFLNLATILIVQLWQERKRPEKG